MPTPFTAALVVLRLLSFDDEQGIVELTIFL